MLPPRAVGGLPATCGAVLTQGERSMHLALGRLHLLLCCTTAGDANAPVRTGHDVDL